MKKVGWNLFLVLFFVIALVDCEGNRQRRQLRNLLESTITLPKIISSVSNGEIYPMPDSLRNTTKLIIYIDSTECSRCVVDNLIRYGGIIEQAKKSKKYSVLFLFGPQKEDILSFQQHLINIRLPYSICIDVENCYLKLNPLVSLNRGFYTILTDVGGKVLMVGDPTESDSVYHLFQDIVGI